MTAPETSAPETPARVCCPPADRAAVALAWHDATCPRGAHCPDRLAEASTDPTYLDGTLHRFLEQLHELADYHVYRDELVEQERARAAGMPGPKPAPVLPRGAAWAER